MANEAETALRCEGQGFGEVPREEIPPRLVLFSVRRTSVTAIRYPTPSSMTAWDSRNHAPIFLCVSRNFTFAGKNITILIMEENPLLKMIEPSAFRHLSELKYLSLKHNALTVPSSSPDNVFLPFLNLVRFPRRF